MVNEIVGSQPPAEQKTAEFVKSKRRLRVESSDMQLPVFSKVAKCAVPEKPKREIVDATCPEMDVCVVIDIDVHGRYDVILPKRHFTMDIPFALHPEQSILLVSGFRSRMDTLMEELGAEIREYMKRFMPRQIIGASKTEVVATLPSNLTNASNSGFETTNAEMMPPEKLKAPQSSINEDDIEQM